MEGSQHDEVSPVPQVGRLNRLGNCFVSAFPFVRSWFSGKAAALEEEDCEAEISLRVDDDVTDEFGDAGTFCEICNDEDRVR